MCTLVHSTRLKYCTDIYTNLYHTLSSNCYTTHCPFLVGGFNPSEQYEFVSWDDDIPNIYIYIWKVTKVMFQTTSQQHTLSLCLWKSFNFSTPLFHTRPPELRFVLFQRRVHLLKPSSTLSFL